MMLTNSKALLDCATAINAAGNGAALGWQWAPMYLEAAAHDIAVLEAALAAERARCRAVAQEIERLDAAERE